ncbi:MAG: L,D-transpeptidase family protein [Methylococcales bacterium]|nr:L,D-transpeptidase family protein [Methylococcales bacterium]
MVNQTTHLGISEITSPKPGIGRPAASVATQVIANENASAANAITSIIATKRNSYLLRPDFQNRAEDLEALYKINSNNLLWLGNAQAEKNIGDVLNLLESASANGLNLTRYDTQTLRQKLPSALSFASDNYKELALYDTAISISLLRFLHDLHYGRVNPKEINFNLKLRETKLIDLPVLIKTSLAQGAISQLPELVEPKLKQYKKLKQALANYRLLASNPALFQFFDKKSINLGSNLPQAEALRDFLSRTGDLQEVKNGSDVKKSNRFSGELVEGIKKFQLRNGINAKGILGINASLGQRMTQIELAMERLRWLPEPSAGASIIVNIPAFQLWAFDDVDEFDVDIPNMRVIVGKALKNETPVLMAKMSFIDFMPYWNVPYSIVKKEILPKLIKNPSYLAEQNMELVSTFGNETKAVGFTGSSISQLQQGSLRIRQRPGKKNALGKVKFIFPNKSDVYMHDTPFRSLFSKSRRDFSHGCVRVAKPDQLAEFALKNQLSKEAIQQALNTQKTRRVILKKSIPVTFFYVTSFIDQYGNLSFYSDIYGYDAVLQDVLNRSGDLSDEAIFAPPPELIPVEAIKAIEPEAQADPVTN